MLIVFGALKIEVAAVLDMMEAAAVTKSGGILFHEGMINKKKVIVAITGMGRLNALKAAGLAAGKYLEQECLPYSLKQGGKEGINILLAGFCGATSKRLKPGDIVFYDSIKNIENPGPLDFKSLNILKLNNSLEGSIPFVTGGTVPRVIVLPGEKKKIGKGLGIEAIDLESYWIGKKILSLGLPFYCLRSVSDALDDRMPGYFGVFSKTRTFFKILGSFLFSIINPIELRSNITALKNIKKAKGSLDNALRSLVSYLTTDK